MNISEVKTSVYVRANSGPPDEFGNPVVNNWMLLLGSLLNLDSL